MKKYLIAFLLVGTLVLGGVSQAKAVTFEELLVEVASLKAQVAALSNKLTATVLLSTTDVTATASRTGSVDSTVTSDATKTTTSVEEVVTTTPTAVTTSNTTKEVSSAGEAGTKTVSTNTTTTTQAPVVKTTSQGGFVSTPATPSDIVARTYISPVRQGDAGSDVIKLQKYLIEKGYLATDTTLGFYGKVTTGAVLAFQKANSIDGDGTIVGARTLAVMNSSNGGVGGAQGFGNGSVALSPFPGTSHLLCMVGSTVPQIKVIYPNGGQTFTPGQQITIKWETCNIPSTALIRLDLVVAPFPPQGVNGVGLANTPNDGSQLVTLPAASAFNGSPMSFGTNFKVYAWYSGSNAADISDNLFTINGPQTACTTPISIVKNPAYPDQTVAPSTVHSKLGSFIIKNNCLGEAVRIANLIHTFQVTNNGTPDYLYQVANVSGYLNGVQIGSTIPTVGAYNTSNFYSGSYYNLAAGQNVTFDIYGDVSAATPRVITMTSQPTALGTLSNNVLSATSAAIGQNITIGSSQQACTFNNPVFITSSSTASQYVVGGTTDATKAQFKFTSNCQATITELGFKDTAWMNAISSARVGSTSAPAISNRVALVGLNILVPAGGAGVMIDEYSSYAPVGINGIPTTTTGDINSTLNLSYVKYTIAGTTYTMCANGDSLNGGNCISNGNMPLMAPTMTIVGSKPVVTLSQPTGVILTTGSVQAVNVTITADAAGPIKIIALPINSILSAIGGSPSFAAAAIVVKDNNNNIINTYGQCGTGTSCSTNININNGGYLINAGQSETFKIFLPVQTLGTGTLPNTYMVSSLAQSNGFIWQDVAGGASQFSQGNITNLIYNYPVSSSSLIHN